MSPLPEVCCICGDDSILDSFQNHELERDCYEWFCVSCLEEIKYSGYRNPECPICEEDITELIDFLESEDDEEDD